ncbi:hypothetical protein HPB50_011331 [Hyalomma asiaticum]|uniref:Uncharacterized protein n=1 Tax=Hyalomma asiaticum TaxID=266040 RepID=A0ACB7RK95_HYAAI|nr:hypothetical protein HPB50_011331 [Hyalomma asiaticum]
MAHSTNGTADILDIEVRQFFQKGLELYGMNGHNNPARLTPAIKKYGADLTYRNELSIGDAQLLRQMLSTGPRVRKLHLHRTMYEAFRVAFHHRGECDSLKEVHFGLVDCSGRDLGISRCGLFGRLHSLHLSCINTGSAFAEDIASYIKQNKLLRELGLSGSCGGVEGVAILIATLTENDTLKKFSLAEVRLPSDSLIAFAKMLASNSALELVDLTGVCPVEKNQVTSLLSEELYSGVFKRLKICWPVQLISEVTELIRKERCCPQLYVNFAGAGAQDDLQCFFENVFEDKLLYGLHVEFTEGIFLDVVDDIVCGVESTTLFELSFVIRGPCNHNGELISILEAFRKNFSITKLSISTGVLMPNTAMAVSELLARNRVLNHVAISDHQGFSSADVKTITKGLRKNYRLISLDIRYESDSTKERSEITALLERNIMLLHKAADFVISGAGVSDETSVDALIKVYSSAHLVELVQKMTGRTKGETIDAIHAALQHARKSHAYYN